MDGHDHGSSCLGMTAGIRALGIQRVRVIPHCLHRADPVAAQMQLGDDGFDNRGLAGALEPRDCDQMQLLHARGECILFAV